MASPQIFQALALTVWAEAQKINSGRVLETVS